MSVILRSVVEEIWVRKRRGGKVLRGERSQEKGKKKGNGSGSSGTIDNEEGEDKQRASKDRQVNVVLRFE